MITTIFEVAISLIKENRESILLFIGIVMTGAVAMVEYGKVYPYRVSVLAEMVEYGERLGLRASALVGMAEHAAIEDDWLRATALIAMVGWGVAEQKRRRRFGPAAQCL